MKLFSWNLNSKEVVFSILIIFLTVVLTFVGVQHSLLIPLGAIFATAFVASIIRNIKFGLVLLLCSYFYVRPIYFLPMSNLTYFRVDDVLWTLVFISWLVNARNVAKKASIRSLPLFWPLLSLCIIAVLSGIRVFILTPSPMPLGNYAWFLFRLLQYVSVYFIVGTIRFSTQERSRLFSIIILCGTVISAIVFLQYLGIIAEFPLPRYIETAGAVTGTFSFKTQIGAVAMILAFLVLDKIVWRKLYWWLGIILFGCFSVLLLITQSRSAWVAFVVGILVYLLTMRTLRSKFFLGTTLIIAGILFFGIESNQQLYNSRPIFDLETGELNKDAAVSARLNSLPVILSYLADNPDIVFFGVGFMNWRYTLSPVSDIYGGHNNFLTAFAELGLFGFIAFCFLIIKGILSAWKSLKQNQPFSQCYMALFVGLCAASFFEDIFWPAFAQESFLAFFLFISALSISHVINKTGQQAASISQLD
jgi:O-antigen ligase